jgi:prevent-host-death family protein
MNQKQISSLKIISALSARTQFGQIMRRASGKKQERFIVDRRGEPKVVIMGIEDYLAHVAEQPEAMALLRAEAKKKGSGAMSMREIDKEIEAYRKERALKNAKTKARA